MCDKCGDEYINSFFNEKSEIKIDPPAIVDLTTITTPEQLLSFLAGMHQPVSSGITCDCGWAEDDFNKTGRFGCPKCYVTFDRKLQNVVFPYHNSSEHLGKRPKNGHSQQSSDDPEERMKVLKLRMAHAIEFEHYEDAAEIKKEMDSLPLRQQP